MMNLVLVGIGALFIIGGFVLTGIGIIKKEASISKYNKFLPIIGLFMVIASLSFTIIPTGMVGVRYRLGIIDETPVRSGFAFKIPLAENIEHVDTRMQRLNLADGDYKINAESKEKALIDVSNVSITYSISPDKAAWFAANVADFKNNIVTVDVTTTAIKGVLKQITTYDATTRTLIEPKVQERLQEILNEKYGDGSVHVYEVILTDMTLEEKYKEAVQQKNMALQKQEQQAIENETSIAKANAEAETARIQAEAKAEAMIAEAEGIAEANRLIAESITDDVLQQHYIDAISNWRPYVVGDNAYPVINLPEPPKE